MVNKVKRYVLEGKLLALGVPARIVNTLGHSGYIGETEMFSHYEWHAKSFMDLDGKVYECKDTSDIRPCTFEEWCDLVQKGNLDAELLTHCRQFGPSSLIALKAALSGNPARPRPRIVLTKDEIKMLLQLAEKRGKVPGDLFRDWLYLECAKEGIHG